MENELLDPPETFEPTHPEIFPSGVVIQASAEGYELLLFDGTVSAEEAIENERPTVMSKSFRPVAGSVFRINGTDEARWYESYPPMSGWPNGPKPDTVFPFTPPTTFVGFYSEDHPEVLR